MENVISIRTEERKDSGKNACKKFRREQKIPAVIYGEHKENVLATVELAELKRVLKSEMGGNAILELMLGKSKENAMIKKVQYDYLHRDIVHVDFLRIDLDKPVEVRVHFTLEGEPIGVKLEGGILDFVTRDIEVRCLPLKIPHEIKINISDLHAGHSIKLSDLPALEGVQFLSAPSTVICLVAKEVEEEAAAPEAAQGEAAAPAAAPAPEAAPAKKE